MEKFKIIRKDFVNNWRVNKNDTDAFYFPLEKALLERIQNTNTEFFIPIQVKAINDEIYNIKLSYFIEALDLLPRKIDVGFDFVWKVFERSLKEKYPSRNITEQLMAESIVYADDLPTMAVIDQLIKIIPIQTWEYIAKVIAEKFDDGKGFENQDGRIKRILLHDVRARRLTNLYDLFVEIKSKYYHIPSASSQRKAATFMRNYFLGNTMHSSGKTFTSTTLERSSILLNCLLYEFRNQRTHANSISPFKSSVATLSTYMHCHLLFLAAYTGMLITGFETHGFKRNVIHWNLTQNYDVFRLFYGNKLMD